MSRAARLAWVALLLGGCASAHAACTLSVVGLNFGTYNTFNALDTKIATTMDVACSANTPYTVSLSSGSGSFAQRTLTNGTHLLAYNLYLDSAYLGVWGDGSSGTGTASGMGTGISKKTTFTVYGRVPAGQNAYVGSYSDTITVTVTF